MSFKLCHATGEQNCNLSCKKIKQYKKESKCELLVKKLLVDHK